MVEKDGNSDGVVDGAVLDSEHGNKKPNAGQFGRGRDPLERVAAKEPVVDPGPVGEEGMPDQLKDMLHVYLRQAKFDRTAGQRACRKWFRENVAGFMAAKTKLEEAWLEARPREVGGVEGVEDVGEGKALEALERCLREREWEK